MPQLKDALDTIAPKSSFRPKLVAISDVASPAKCPKLVNVRGLDPEQHAADMSDAQLCKHIQTALAPAKKAIRSNITYIAEARKRFAKPGRRVPVAGKPTWCGWIETNLGISDRHVRRLLAEYKDPSKKLLRKKSKQPLADKHLATAAMAQEGIRLAKLIMMDEIVEAKKVAAAMIEAAKKNPVVAPTDALQRMAAELCQGGCGQLHIGIAEVIKGHRNWREKRIADYCGVSSVTVRQAATRFDLVINNGRIA